MQIRQIAVIALIAVGAVACTSSGSDGPTSTPSSTAPSTSSTPTTATPTTTSPSPTPTVATTGPNVRPGDKPPTLDATAKLHTPIGELHFSMIWIRALDWGYATNDSTLARSLFGSGCTECERFAAIFDKVKAAGNHFRGGRLSFESNTIVTNDSRHPGTSVIDVVFGQEALRVVNASQKTVSSAPRQASVRYREWLRAVPNGWSVVDFKQVVTT